MAEITLETLVPFGKYKGQPFALMMADAGYCNWMMSNTGIVERYPDIIKAITHGTGAGEYSCTPEHNKLQMLFMDTSYREGLVKLMKANMKQLQHFEHRHEFLDVCDKIKEIHTWEKEQLPSLVAERDRLKCLTALDTKPVTYVEFERGNWDLVITGKIDTFCPTCNEAAGSVIFLPLFVELKPTVSEDYPAILRKVTQRTMTSADCMPLNKYAASKVVIAKSFTATSATLEQVKHFFNLSGVHFFTLYEIECAGGLVPEWLRGEQS